MLRDDSRTDPLFPAWLRDPTNQDAWAEFDSRYRPKIVRWCRARGLTPDDADDVSQDVILNMQKAIHKFNYDPMKGKFRGWLKTITQNAVNDFFGRNPPRRYQELLPDIQGTDLSGLIDELARRETHEIALRTLRGLVNPRDYGLFCDHIFHGIAARELAGREGIGVGAVHTAVFRAKQLYKEILLDLGEGDAREDEA